MKKEKYNQLEKFWVACGYEADEFHTGIANVMESYAKQQSAEQQKRITDLERLLKHLDLKGGLGLDIHSRIEQLFKDH